MQRVATLQSFNQGLESLNQLRADIAKTQQQIASGKRVSRASDDPVAASRIERANATLSRLQADERAVQISKTAMELADASLTSAADLMAEAREIIVAAGNGTISAQERGSLAQRLGGVRATLLSLANQPDGSGGYVFAGLNATAQSGLNAALGAPAATSLITISNNLTPNAAVTEDPLAPATIDFSDTSTFNFQGNPLRVYDASGVPLVLNTYYQKSAANTWNLYVSANGQSLSNDAAGARPVARISFDPTNGAPTSTNATPVAGDPGTITYFDANYSASTTTVSGGSIALPAITAQATLAGSGTTQALGPITVNLSGLTQKPSAVTGVIEQSQNGRPTTQLFASSNLNATVLYSAVAGESSITQAFESPISLDGRATWGAGLVSGNGAFEASPGTPASATASIRAGRVLNPSLLTQSVYDIQYSAPGQLTISRQASAGVAASTITLPYSPGTPNSIDGMEFEIMGAVSIGDKFVITPAANSSNVFDWMGALIATLSTPSASNDQIAQAVARGLDSLNASEQRIQQTQGRVGSALNSLEHTATQMQQQTLDSENARAQSQDVDLGQAIADLKTRQASLEAALQSYASVNRLSLFEYLR